MARTLGQRLRALADISKDEVRVAQEKHSLGLGDQIEEFRIVLTRPLIVCNSREILKVTLSRPSAVYPHEGDCILQLTCRAL